MNATVNRGEFLSVIKKCSLAFPDRATLPILHYCRLQFDANRKTMTGTGTDLDIFIKAQCKLKEIDGDSRLCVPTKRMIKVLDDLSSDELDLTIESGDHSSLLIKAHGGKGKYQFYGQSDNDFPAIHEELTFDNNDRSDIIVNSVEFESILNSVMFSVGKGETREVLNGVQLIPDQEALTLRLVTTDGRRLSTNVCALVSSSTNTKPIVPAKAMRIILGLLDKKTCDATMLVGNKFECMMDSVIVGSTMLEGDMPQWTDVVPSNPNIIFNIHRSDFIGALRRVAQFSVSEATMIKMTINEGTVVLSSSASDVGEGQDEVDMGSGWTVEKPIELGMNHRYLEEALSNAPSGEVTLHLVGFRRPVEITNDRYHAIVMPMRLEGVS